MCDLIMMLGLVGFVGGVIAIVALGVQRDYNRQLEAAAKREKYDHNGAA